IQLTAYLSFIFLSFIFLSFIFLSFIFLSFIFLSFIPYIPPDFASGQGTHEDLVSVAVSMPGRGEGGLDI
ncbi:hypothetical protein, partial [Eisenbergiella tayi]|uniref:hypothetical protein n=1 Tax=Eisenbergiella tayi TaxID=1432052 RepID=UPI0022E03522